MKFTFIVFLSVIGVTQHAFSQSISYSYDDSGNRISKVAYSSQAKKSKMEIKSVSFEDDADQVRIKLPKNDSSSLYVIRVYSFTGILLYSKVGITGTSNVSLTDYPNGVYIVKVEHDGNTISHKFIKK